MEKLKSPRGEWIGLKIDSSLGFEDIASPSGCLGGPRIYLRTSSGREVELSLTRLAAEDLAISLLKCAYAQPPSEEAP